jgi:hypothetical protein
MVVAVPAKAGRRRFDPCRGNPLKRMRRQRINHWRQVIYVTLDTANPMDATSR